MKSAYLTPNEARGCEYCYDPESPMLREALTGPRPHEDTALQSESLLKDLVFFHRLVQKQYAAYPDLLQHRNFDPEAFFSRWKGNIRGAGETIPFHEGIIEPLVELRQVVPDSHLTFLGADPILEKDERLAINEFQALSPDSAIDTDELCADDVPGAYPSTLRIAPMLRADGSLIDIITISASGPATSLTLRCGDRSIQLHRRPAASQRSVQTVPATVPVYEYRAVDDTALITLRSFSSSGAAGEQLRRFVKDYPKHFESRNILFDLRDNNGGTLQFVQQWINQARSGEWRSYPRLEIVGALWPCSLWNIIVERQIREGSVDTAEAKRERAQLRAEWGSLPPPLTSRLDTGYRSGRATSPYEGRVFVLVNRNSGSSGELAAVELKRAMKAVILGERSYGAMQYGEARRFVLPNTGLICQLPTKRFYFDDQVESVGWPVDVYLDRIDQEPAELVPYLDALSKVNQY